MRCPECKKDYFDDSLVYCLDDGVALDPATLQVNRARTSDEL